MNDTVANEIDLQDVLTLLRQRYLRVLTGAAVGAVAAAALSLTLPNMYQADAKVIVQPQAPTLGFVELNLASLGSGNLMKNPGELYASMALSRSVVDSVVEKFKLQDVYRVETQEDARETFQGRTKVLLGKDNIIKLEVSDLEPTRAADLANALVTELQKTAQTLSVSQAERRRALLDEEVAKSHKALAEAAARLREAREKTGIIDQRVEAESAVATSGGLTEAIAIKRAEIASMTQFMSASNPELARKRAELSQLEGAAAGQRNAKSSGFAQKAEILSTAQRDYAFTEAKHTLLMKQYESSRLEAASDPLPLQVLDQAVVPQKKAGPRRTLITLGGLLTGGLSVFGLYLVGLAYRPRRDEKADFAEKAGA